MNMQTLWRDDFPRNTSPAHFFAFASRPHLVRAGFALLSVVAAASLYASSPYIFKLITNAALELRESGTYDTLIHAAILYIVILAAAKGIWRVSGFIGSTWATAARATARHALTAYVTLHSRSYFSDRFAGSIANKISRASNAMVDLVELILWQFVELVIASIGSFIIAFTTNAAIAWVFLAWLLSVIVFNMYFVRRRIPVAAQSQRLETGLTGITVDLLGNISTMQEYGRRRFEIDRLKYAINERRKAGLRNWHYGEFVLVANNVLQVIFGSAMVYLALLFAQSGKITPGDIILVITIIFNMERLFQSLGSQFNKFAETWGEIRESLEEIVEPHEIPDKPGAQKLLVEGGAIILEKVNFSYEKRLLFDKLDLVIKPGERVGLVGRSGAGKSTLLRLILHHHDIDAGTIQIDGMDISLVTQESLRQAIGVVPQEPLLFHRTVHENVAYGKPDATRDEVIAAAKLAQAHDFILRLSKGYDAVVGERGVKLSGGERQRIAIARAIIKNAPILLLDEATAALDSESEVAIQEALWHLMKGKTVIAIAHRLSTLREMDRILVMDHGKVVQDANHEALIREKGIYQELWNRQAGGFISGK